METAIKPEKPCFAVVSQVSLHTLKTAHPVMQGLSSRMHWDVSKGFDNRLTPALSIYMLHQEHVISEGGAKDKVLYYKHTVICLLS